MHGSGISIWFFNGVLLTVYGALIFSYGLYEVVTGQLANVVLANLHAPLWWGGFMLVVGIGYCVRFNPKRTNASE